MRQLILSLLTCLSLTVFALSSCKENEDPPSVQKEQLDIESASKKVEVDKSPATVEVRLITNQPANKLKIEQSGGTWYVATLKEDDEKNVSVEIKVRENTTGEKRQGTITVKTESKLNSQTITLIQYGNSQVMVAEDIKISPISADASAAETGYSKQGIEYSIDGDFSTHYHSPWNGTSFPVILEYKFSGKDVIDYLVYYTRNGNGNFGKVTIYVATDAGRTYEKLGDYDFNSSLKI